MLFESLALAEQLSLLLKTSSHDEEALSALASSIKSGIPDLHLPLSDSASSITIKTPTPQDGAASLSRIIILSTNHPRSPASTHLRLPHLILCIASR